MKFRQLAKRWLYGSCPGFAGAFPYFGTRVFFPRNSLIFHRACGEGIFEVHVLRLIFSLAQPKTTYIDIGANIGLMSVPALAMLSDLQVCSIEPSPATLPCLRRTAQASRFGSRWRIVGKAMSDGSGATEFFSCADNGGALDGLKDTQRGPRPLSLPVQSTTVDEVWSELGRPSVSCMKIDVEGAELSVLRGSRQCLAHSRPAVVLEWNSVNLAAYQCPPEALLTFAVDSGYDLFGVRPVCRISSAAALRLLMKSEENFLMLPKDQLCRNGVGHA